MQPESPPGHTESVYAERVLVLAPHFDDEILGCGGLLIQLLEAGAAVEVLFLTDGSGGVPSAVDGESAAYIEKRRQEARAVAERLGFAMGELAFVDGSLDRAKEDLTSALESHLLQSRPQLLLLTSPLEVSADHRAAFAAVHHLLGGIRAGDELEPLARDLEVLVYEVNHALYPNLLVDVSSRVEALAQAMELYSSQQEQHDYWGAALGRRKFRTLTLAPGVEAVEAYRRLTFTDFVTHGPSALIAHLGGGLAPSFESSGSRFSPRVSVIVRTKDRPQLLAQALDSLARSSYRNLEVVMVNDGGTPPEIADPFPLSMVRVDLETNQGRAAAANHGIAAATGEYITFLDDDDLVEREHFETLVSLVGAAGVRVAYTDAAVGVYHLDGEEGWKLTERRLPYSRSFDAERLLVDNYIPFHTLMIEHALIEEVGELDRDLPFFEDWDFLIRLAALTPFHHLSRVTCEYRQMRGAGHHILADRPGEKAEFLEVKARVLEKHRSRLAPEVIARVVDGLRAENVGLVEELSGASREQKSQAQRFHELNGKLQASEDHAHHLRGQVEILQSLEQRLSHQIGEEKQLTEGVRNTLAEVEAAAETRSEELRAAYAEIQRQQDLLRAMESTKAWRMHEKLQRWKS